MPPFRAARRILLLLAVATAPLARAEERPSAGEDIEVLGQRPAASPEAPAAQATVIDTSRFAGEVRSVGDLLISSPGVAVHSLGGPGQATTLSLRGATADESLVLLDGIPLQGAGGGAVDLSTLPAVLLDRMVVSRGVLGAQFGAGALGGAVELVPRAARTKATAGAQASFGSFGTAQLAADAAGPVGSGGSALVAIQGDRTGGGFDYARQLTTGGDYYGFTRKNADATRGSLLARGTTAVGGTGIDLLLQGSGGERGVPGPWTAPTGRTRQLDLGALAGLRARGTAGEAAWSARLWGRFDRIEQRGSLQFQDCEDGSPGCPRIEQRSLASRAEFEAAVPVASAHLIRTSFSAGQDRVHGGDIDPHQRTVASVALSDDWAATRALSLHPALRFDAVQPDAALSPALAALWKHGPLELRGGWGLSFRAPSFNELYLHSAGIGSNPDLRPERAWSLDAGAAWRTGALTLSAGVFTSRYRDLVVYELHPSANEVTPRNVGSARISGLELQAVLQLPAGFVAEAAWSYLDAVNLRPGAQENRQLAYRPPQRLFLRLAHRGARVEGYGETSFTSRMPRNQYGSAFLPPQLLVNAGAGVRVAGPLWLDVEARNLLADETLEDLFQYPMPGLSIAAIARARL